MKINYHESDLTLLSVYSCKRQSNFSNDKKIICFGLSKQNYINIILVSIEHINIPIYSIEVLHFVSLEENVANVAVLEIMRPL